MTPAPAGPLPRDRVRGRARSAADAVHQRLQPGPLGVGERQVGHRLGLPHLHPQLWDASEVKNVHFIIDKPWERRPEPGDRYAELHQLWWDAADATPGLVAPAPQTARA